MQMSVEELTVSHSKIERSIDPITRAINDCESFSAMKTALRAIVEDSLQRVDKEDTVNILNWGLQEKYLVAEKAKMSDYGPIIPMMFKSLEQSRYYRQVEHLLLQKV